MGRKGGLKYNNVSQYMEPSQDTCCEYLWWFFAEPVVVALKI